MQRVDYLLGVPITFGLSCLRILFRPLTLFVRRQQAVNNILFIELSEMGSAFLAYPAFIRTLELKPEAEVHFLIFEKHRDTVALLKLFKPQNIITIDESSFLRFALSALKALLQTRRLSVDTTIDLELFSRFTAIFAFLTGARTRIGFDNYTDEGLYRGGLITHRVLYNNLMHMSQNFISLVEALSVESPSKQDLPLNKRPTLTTKLTLPPVFEPEPAELTAMQEKLLLLLPAYRPGSRLILVNPDPGALPLRAWPLNNYAELLKTVLNRYADTLVGIIGLEDSKATARLLYDQLDPERVADLTGQTHSLKELLVLYCLSTVLITSDSGPAHLASLASTPALTLFGPESPQRYAPLSNKALTFFSHYACSPCYSAANHRYSICKRPLCMEAITVNELFNSLKGVLDAKQ